MNEPSLSLVRVKSLMRLWRGVKPRPFNELNIVPIPDWLSAGDTVYVWSHTGADSICTTADKNGYVFVLPRNALFPVDNP